MTVHFPGRLLRSYLKGLERMEEEPEHMSREQGEGLGRGPVDGRLRAAERGLAEPSVASCFLLSSAVYSDPASFP